MPVPTSDRPLANNTIRGRTAVVAALLRWCARSGIPAPAPEYLTDADSPLRQFRPTYGKLQSPESASLAHEIRSLRHPPDALDDSPMGRRDELVIRLGLAGVRAQEIAALKIGDVRDLDTDHPSLYWTGKRYKPLHIALGPQTVAALRRYLADYRQQLDAELPADAPLICRRRPGRTARGQHHELEYGKGLTPGASGRASILEPGH